MGKTYAWRIDAIDAAGKVARRGTVSTFSTESANSGGPDPADGSIRVEGGSAVLCWKPGKHAVRQNLYFGASAEAVGPGAKPAIEGLPPSADSAPLPVATPAPGTTCWWRMESINGGGLSVSHGETWSFRTVMRKLPVYLVAGQSNAVGCCLVNGLPAGLRGFQVGAIAFVRGECRLGEYGWAWSLTVLPRMWKRKAFTSAVSKVWV